jgi:hypothetical protein
MPPMPEPQAAFVAPATANTQQADKLKLQAEHAHAALVAAQVACCLLTYADVCRRMLTYACACRVPPSSRRRQVHRMLTYADVC